MTGLSKITDKILAEAKEDAAAKLAAADEKCAEIGLQYEEKINEIKKSIEANAHKEAKEIVSRAKSSEAMERRNIVLGAKSALIDGVFERAKKEILNMPEDKYAQFLMFLLMSAVRSQANEEADRAALGDEDEVVVESYEVIFNEKDREKFGQKVVAAVSAKATVPFASKIVLSGETAQIEGGLLLKFGKTTINSSIETVFAQVRPRLEARVSKILFPEKKG